MMQVRDFIDVTDWAVVINLNDVSCVQPIRLSNLKSYAQLSSGNHIRLIFCFWALVDEFQFAMAERSAYVLGDWVTGLG